ncbi:MAG: DUF1552 domain-containing protein [Planctomycetales bacterium]|nr:DUF1552 domain-containing protein [Planctomycetales bacterium]
MKRFETMIGSRRSFLRGAGALLTLPLLDSAPASLAAGSASSGTDAAEPKKRLVCLGVALSMYPGQWNPQEAGRNYTAPKLIQPLEALRNDFTLISNVDHPTVSGGHLGTPAFLSGVYDPKRLGQSIVVNNRATMDQVAAKVLGSGTRYESLQLAATNSNSGNGILSWSHKGVPLPAESDPVRLFQQLFGQDDDLSGQRLAMQRGTSVLDLVLEEAKDLNQVLNTEDRGRIDEYMTSVRDVERRIERQLEWLETPKPGGIPPITQRPTTFHENLDLLLELTALALQTDSTRVISVTLPGGGLPIEYGDRRVSDYHGQSHHGMDPDVVAELVEIETLHAQSLAKFLTRLKGMQDGSASLLDRTQVLFGSGLGNGSSHSNRDLPILLAGGGFRHGQHLRLKEGTPLSNVFVTILQQLGLEQDSFADSDGNINEHICI